MRSNGKLGNDLRTRFEVSFKLAQAFTVGYVEDLVLAEAEWELPVDEVVASSLGEEAITLLISMVRVWFHYLKPHSYDGNCRKYPFAVSTKKICLKNFIC